MTTDPIAALADRAKALELNPGQVDFRFTGGGRGFSLKRGTKKDGDPYEIRDITISTVLTGPADKRNTKAATAKAGVVPLIYQIRNELTAPILEVWNLYASSTTEPDTNLGARVMAILDAITTEEVEDKKRGLVQVEVLTDEQYEELDEIIDDLIGYLADVEATGSLRQNNRYNPASGKYDLVDTYNPWIIDTRKVEITGRRDDLPF